MMEKIKMFIDNAMWETLRVLGYMYITTIVSNVLSGSRKYSFDVDLEVFGPIIIGMFIAIMICDGVKKLFKVIKEKKCKNA